MAKLPLTFRQSLTAAVLIGVMAALLAENNIVGQAVQEGLLLCVRSVIPALFPFFAVVSLAIACDFFGILRQLGLPVSTAAFVLGIIGGYPVGGRTVGELYRQGELSKQQAVNLLCCCNNSGPSFILGIAGAGVFHSRSIGLALYGIHVVTALLAGLLLRRKAAPGLQVLPEKRDVSAAQALVDAVRSAAESMLYVCAFVVFFLTLTALITELTGLTHPLILGMLESTGGILRLHADRAGFIMAAGLLGWGGISVHCQTAAVLEGTGLPMGRYLAAKALQGVLSMALAGGVSRFLL